MKISDSDLIALKDLRWQAELAKSTAENADLRKQLAQEKLQNFIFQIYRRYNINAESNIDLASGNIIQMLEPAVQENKESNVENE